MKNGFLYFVPEARDRPNAERIAELDLTERLGDSFAHATVNDGKGPGNVRGVVLGPGGDAVPYVPTAQTWQACEHWSIGVWNNRRPTAADLARPKQLTGKLVTLGDGGRWVVPIAALQPKRLTIDTAGNWYEADTAAATALFAEADQIRGEWWENVYTAWLAFTAAQVAARAKLTGEGDNATVPEAEAEAFSAAHDALTAAARAIPPAVALDILGRNYVIGAPEAAILELFHVAADVADNEVWRVVDAFVDGPEVRAARAGKKN